jgi:hypothetical protein
VCLTRLVALFITLLQYYFHHGTIPYHDTLSSILFTFIIESYHWMYYLVSFNTLLIINIISNILLPMTRPLAFFLLDFDRGPASRQVTRQSKSCTSGIIASFDVRLLILTCYCCYPWWAQFFSRSTHWHLSLLKAQLELETMIALPTDWIISRALLWPPDGPLLKILLFSFLLLSQVYIIILCIFKSI